MQLARPQIVKFEAKTAKEHSKNDVKSDRNGVRPQKINNKICSAPMPGRLGGASGRLEDAKRRKSGLRTSFRGLFEVHFEDLGGVKADQEDEGRGPRCPLLEKSIF